MAEWTLLSVIQPLCVCAGRWGHEHTHTMQAASELWEEQHKVTGRIGRGEKWSQSLIPRPKFGNISADQPINTNEPVCWICSKVVATKKATQQTYWGKKKTQLHLNPPSLARWQFALVYFVVWIAFLLYIIITLPIIMLTILFIDNIFLSFSNVCVFYFCLLIICCFTVQNL